MKTKKRWPPERGQICYRVAIKGDEYWIYDCICYVTTSVENCFRTKREAQAALKRVKAALRG